MTKFLRYPSAWITALISLVILAAYEILHPYGFFYDDNVYFFLPSYTLNYEALSHGTIAQINLYQYLGYTPLADSQSGTWYFPVYLAMGLAKWLGQPPIAIEWLCWVHLAAAALVVKRYARLWKISSPKSVLVAIFYLTQPMIFDAPQLCVCVAYVVFYVPLVFLCLELLLREPTRLRFGWFVLAKTCFFLSGHPNYFALSLVYEAAYVLLGPRFLSMAGRLGALSGFRTWILANLLCGCWSLISLGPVLMHLPLSEERGFPLVLGEALNRDLNLIDFLKVQIDNSHISSLNIPIYLFPDTWFYLGGSLLFIPLMIFYGKEREVRFFSVLFLLGLIFCTPAFLLLHSLPIYDSFRYPGKNFIFAALFYSIAMGLLLRMPTSHLFNRIRLVAVYGGILCNILTSFSYEKSPVGPGHLFHRYDVDFHLPVQQLREGRSVLATFDWYNPHPDFLAFLFATEAKIPAFQGYDPLISQQNFREALETNYQGVLHEALTDSTVQHLRSWSVRYYFFDQDLPGLAYVENSTLFRKIWQTGPVGIYEYLDPVPMVYFADQPAQAVPYRFEANSVYLTTKGHTGQVSISLVPLRGYSWRGEDGLWHEVQAKKSGRMTFDVTTASDQIELRYREPYLPMFILISVATFLLWLFYCGCFARTGRTTFA